MAEIHQLFTRETTYGPEQLKVLGTAFDSAWESVVGTVGDAPPNIESARTRLATVILSLPCSEIHDAERIKNTALQVMRFAREIKSDSMKARVLTGLTAPQPESR